MVVEKREPIRVLHVVTHMNRGGLESMLMNYYRHIDKKRIQFDFLTHRPYDGDFGDEIKSLGGEIYHLPKLNPFSKKYMEELKCFFSSHTYEIVHSHLDCMSAYPLCAAKQSGVKVRIAHAHSKSQDKDAKYIIKLIEKKKIPRYATHLFACGKEAGEWMFSGQTYQIMNNAIEVKKYKYNDERRVYIRHQFGITDEFVVGHVGRFNYPKNHTFLIDIFKKIHDVDKTSKLLLVGGGEKAEDIKKKVKDLGLEHSVIFAGICSNVNELIQAMDVFVFPSIYEGLPVTMVEAQAAGLPCVMSGNVPKETVLTDLVDVMSLSESAEEWAKKILTYKGFKREDYSEKIKKMHFDIESNAKWLMDVYENAIRVNEV